MTGESENGFQNGGLLLQNGSNMYKDVYKTLFFHFLNKSVNIAGLF